MAVIESTRSAASVGLMDFVHKIVAKLSAWHHARVTRKALSQLSDRQLEDIGLTRGDINRMRF